MRTGKKQPMQDIDRFAYKGYYVTGNTFNGSWYISKDGSHISSAASSEDAKRIIDSLLEPIR